MCQPSVYCLSALRPSFIVGTVKIGFEGGMMLNFVSRGRWKDTAWRRGFSLSSHAVPLAASGSYQELLPAVGGQVGGGLWHLSPSSFRDTPDGFAVRGWHQQSAASSAHLRQEGGGAPPAC